MAINYSKWDALELSDDSDIEVHPNVDKRSFIRAKQSQIHMERQQRKLQISALRYERTVNDGLLERLQALISALESRRDAPAAASPADVAFRVIMESAASKPDEDSPPPRPEGVFHEDSPAVPTFSKMMVALLDEVSKEVDRRQLQSERRYEAFVQELGSHVFKIQDLQKDLVKRLDVLEQQESKKITSESYRVGFDSSHVSKAKQGEQSKGAATAELLNPNYNGKIAEPSVISGGQATADIPGDSAGDLRASPVAMRFAQIPEHDYRASHDFIVAHPEMLQHESETVGLFMAAYRAMLDDDDGRRARRYVHQGVLLQFCRALGRDGAALFFKCLATPGHRAREEFASAVAERFEAISKMAKRDAKRPLQEGEGIEKTQLYPVGEDGPSAIQVPPAESEDEEVRRARAVYETFAPQMRAALESGSLDQVNRLLGAMDVAEAEKAVGLLQQAGCLSIVDEVVDGETEDGTRFPRNMGQAGAADAEHTGLRADGPGGDGS